MKLELTKLFINEIIIPLESKAENEINNTKVFIQSLCVYILQKYTDKPTSMFLKHRFVDRFGFDVILEVAG